MPFMAYKSKMQKMIMCPQKITLDDLRLRWSNIALDALYTKAKFQNDKL